MSWRARIRQASFRGVKFGVQSGELEAGRRVVVHEFPQRDEPYLEDMGAAPFKFTLKAFVLGPDYLSRRDELEKALQDPSPGTLVHPWHGEIEVAQFAPYKVSHSARDGGMCVFSLSFARTEKPNSPAASVNPVLRCLLACDLSGSYACRIFDEAVSFVSESSFVVSQSLAIFKNALNAAESAMGGDFSPLYGILGDLTGFDFSLGARLWEAFSGVFQGGSSGAGGEFSGAGITAEKAASAWARAACAGYSVPAPPHAGSARRTIRQNGLAFVQFTRSISVIEACKAAVSAQPASREAAVDLKNELVAAYDAALAMPRPQYAGEYAENLEERAGEYPAADFAPSAWSGFCQALNDARGYALASLALAAKLAPEVAIITPAQVLPALVIAYRHSGDASLAADLASRNKIPHPGFSPAAPLEALCD